jgi:hypothetical protein
MSDPTDAPDDGADIRRDSGDPNRDRADLADQAPAQADADTISQNAGDGDADHDDADAART